jgi:hypothetical protein
MGGGAGKELSAEILLRKIRTLVAMVIIWGWGGGAGKFDLELTLTIFLRQICEFHKRKKTLLTYKEYVIEFIRF